MSLSVAMAGVFHVWCSAFLLVFLLSTKALSYEKTLRKIVRNQSKMVQRPFSDHTSSKWKNASRTLHYSDELLFPGVSHVKAMYRSAQRPRISTIYPASSPAAAAPNYKRINTDSPSERLTRHTFPDTNATVIPVIQNYKERSNVRNMTIKNFYQIPHQTRFFPPIDDNNFELMGNTNEHSKRNDSHYRRKSIVAEHRIKSHDIKENTIIIPNNNELINDITGNIPVKGIIMPKSHLHPEVEIDSMNRKPMNTTHSLIDFDTENEEADFFIEEFPMERQKFTYNLTRVNFACAVIRTIKTDIDAQHQFSHFNIEPLWMIKKQFWNSIFDSRYEALMRNPKWPSLKVFLVPRVQIDTIWKQTFEQYHHQSVNKILSNIVKKLQFYEHLTFSWNEVSHLSYWWRTITQKTRTVFRNMLKDGRLEITTGGWVQPDEATTHLFGLVHQFIEGHQWLKQNLNYVPEVAWLTNTVSHSPTMTYLLSALNINEMVFTNLHFSWEQYLAEYQYSDFIWLQNWDQDKSHQTQLSEDLARIGYDRFPKHAVLTHYLQFNSDNFQACGPNGVLCSIEYNFDSSHKNLDITPFNIKDKAEKLLEQYSKTGTISLHNTMIAPISGPRRFELQSEFDFQYNNYLKIADYVNTNKEIYKATIEFGTAKDYFRNIKNKHKKYPTLKGDFLNFADVTSGSPAYWSGFYTSRPFTKILLRRLQATLRTTEILFTFALNMNVFHNYNVSDIFQILIKARENVARLVDRNVQSGTVSANVLKYVHDIILTTVKDCWHIQEISASFLTSKPELTKPYLQKYVYREGELISAFKSVGPGDQIYIFNSLSHERTEIVEIITRIPNIKIFDHNKKEVTIQVNPVWKHNSDNLIKLSRRYFKICFAVMVPPLTLSLFKITETYYDAVQDAATLYCLTCIVDTVKRDGRAFPFSIHPIQSGDIQLENYKHRLLFDEFTGFLKTVVEKETNIEKTVFIDYGAFKDSSLNSGMFLFNTNVSKPIQDMLVNYRLGRKAKIMFIISGQVTTELVTIYGRLLQHTTKMFNLLHGPLSNAICIESTIDFEVSPKNRELEMFLSIQTDILNGNPPQIYTDNNSFQYTSRILNISRRIESNLYPITSMAYIQDRRSRLTFITDHAQGVTALQEGQLVVMLDRRVLYNDGRGTGEGLADSKSTHHRNYILLENLADHSRSYDMSNSRNELILPSASAFYLSNSLNYFLDIFSIEKNHTDLCYYLFMPLIKTAFPCDVTILNYRVVLNKYNLVPNIPNNALMILHRQSFSCQMASSSLLLDAMPNCHGDSNFAIHKILRNIKSVYQTNLAGTDDGEPILNYNLVNFPPMELMTLRIEF